MIRISINIDWGANRDRSQMRQEEKSFSTEEELERYFDDIQTVLGGGPRKCKRLEDLQYHFDYYRH